MALIISTFLSVGIFIIIVCLHYYCLVGAGENDSEIFVEDKVESSKEYINIPVNKYVEQEEEKVEKIKDYEVVEVIAQVHHVDQP